MNVMRDFFGGIFTVVSVIGKPMLYRYPYRNSAEGLRGDWLRLGDDIREAFGEIEAQLNDDE